MPYIPLERRAGFKPYLQSVVSIVTDKNDSLYVQGDYFGYFLNRICRKCLSLNPTGNPMGNISDVDFNLSSLTESKKKTLINAVDKLVATMSHTDPISFAGELNYVVTAVLWGMMGAAKDVPEASYGFRAYLTGIVDKVSAKLFIEHMNTAKDSTMAIRRHLVVRGVLHNVLSETYVKKMTPYEFIKESETGSIWNEGDLNVEYSG